MKHVLFILTLVSFSFLTSFPAGAEQTTGGYVACLQERWLDEAVQAAVKKDRRGFNYLINKKRCVVLKEGLPVSVLDTSWDGVVKIRVYLGDKGITLWTVNEGIKD